jgi:hypothetical protein
MSLPPELIGGEHGRDRAPAKEELEVRATARSATFTSCHASHNTAFILVTVSHSTSRDDGGREEAVMGASPTHEFGLILLDATPLRAHDSTEMEVEDLLDAAGE